MKKVLIVYYTQTGQLKRIADSVAAPLQDSCKIVYEELRPVPPYPFPWKGMPFFQVFPESVKEIPCKLEPFHFDPQEDFDLVILAYQVWYLSPSVPVTSFLQSEAARQLLNGRPVITLLGVRNMWVMAQERVKAMISAAGGRLAGNIVLSDPAPNLASVITIVRWMMKGEKAPFRWLGKKFPAAGVPEEDISGARVYGEIILKHLSAGSHGALQRELVSAGAVKVDPVLVNIEKRGKLIFGIWARMILQKGAYGDPAREGRLKAFKYYLFMVIYLVSPFVSALFCLIFLIHPGAADRIVKKYADI